MLKQIVIIACLCAMAPSLSAQDSTRTITWKNEFGLDATGFLQQFLYFNNSQFPTYYTPVYYVTYRRHFGKCNLRSAIGGYIYHHPFETPYPNDPNSYEHNTQQLSFRIGWEWTNELAKRWQVFYGMDYLQGFLHDQNDAPYWNGGYANGRETTTIIYGIGPLLGMRFRLTDRISLSTEASLSCNLEIFQSRRYYFSTDPQVLPTIPDQKDPKATNYYTSFAQPLSVFFTFDL